MSPFYDLLSTRIYSHYGVATDLAMKIGGAGNPDAVQKMHWEQFAGEIGVKPGLVFTRIKDLAKKTREISQQLFKGPFADCNCDALCRLMELIAEQSDKTTRRIS